MKINSGTQSFNMINKNNLSKDEKKGIEDKFSLSKNTDSLDKELVMKPSFKENMKEIARDGLVYGSVALFGGTAGLLMAGAGILGQTGGIQGAAAMSLLTGIAAYKVIGGSGGPGWYDNDLSKSNAKIGLAAAGIALGCGAISAVSTPLAVGAGFVAGAAGLYSLMDK